MSKAELKITHAVMGCCGVVGGQGFDYGVYDEKLKHNRPSTFEDQQECMKQLIEEQTGSKLNWPRTCALVMLSSDQAMAIKAVEGTGFKRIHEFYNPNSTNQVYIYAHTISHTKEEWDASPQKAEYQKRMQEAGKGWHPVARNAL